MMLSGTFTFIFSHSKLNIMGMKYSTTTADYLDWEIAMNLIRKLAKDENYKMSLLVAIGCFTGLRISDILALAYGYNTSISQCRNMRRRYAGKLTNQLPIRASYI